MEQHRTRPDRSGPRRGTPALPPQAGSGGPGDRPDRLSVPPSAPRRTRRASAGPRAPQDGPAPVGDDSPRSERSRRSDDSPRDGVRPPRGRPGPSGGGAAGRSGRAGAAAGRPPRSAAPPGRLRRRPPGPRLTGLGGGLFCSTATVAAGSLDRLLTGASLTVYGVLFLLVCVPTACWVRRGDLVAAPVVVPIAFAAGLVPLAGGEGLTGRLVGLFTALATQAGWLYGGTLVAGLIVTVRALRPAPRRPAVPRDRAAGSGRDGVGGARAAGGRAPGGA